MNEVAHERAQRWRQEAESRGERVEQLLEAVACLLNDIARLGAGEVSGQYLPQRGDVLMTVREGAAYLRVSERTLRRWVAEHRVKHEKTGACVRFKLEWLDKVKPAHRRRAAALTGLTGST